MPAVWHRQPTLTSLGRGCLGVTCHPHFWQNDQGLSHATAVTLGEEQTLNKSQYKKLTLEKTFLLLFLLGFKL